MGLCLPWEKISITYAISVLRNDANIFWCFQIKSSMAWMKIPYITKMSADGWPKIAKEPEHRQELYTTSFVGLIWIFKDHKRCVYIYIYIQICNGATVSVSYPILSILYMLMPWRLNEPGHQQAWYWPNKPEYSVSSIRRVNVFSDPTDYPKHDIEFLKIKSTCLTKLPGLCFSLISDVVASFIELWVD